jgi:UDP-N-acetylglucosamine:LPS N-acetylglucosamine transferase
MKGKTLFIRHAERNWLVLYNFYEAWKILKNEKPDILLSTGAGPIVPFAILARLFFRTKIIFVETITRIKKPSMTAKIMYYFSHDFYYQWEELRLFFPKAKFCGTII